MGKTMEDHLQDRIHNFMDRKAREHPDLNLLEKWGDYEVTPLRDN